MAVKITDKMTTEGKKFMKELEELSRLEVRIGYQQGNTTEDGVGIVDIAMFNELGTYNSPSRPFLRDSVDTNESKINSFLQSMRTELLQGGSAESVLKKIGSFQKGLIQEQIVNGKFVKNSDITINGGWMRNKKSGKPFYVEGKHSDKPLNGKTGTLRGSVNFVIQEKGGSD